MSIFEPKYKIDQKVYCWEWNLLFGWFPSEYKIMSKRKLGIFGFYYLTRIVERKFYGGYLSPERVTHKIRERSIEYVLNDNQNKENAKK